MSTPPPRAGQTAANAAGRPGGYDRPEPGPYGYGQPDPRPGGYDRPEPGPYGYGQPDPRPGGYDRPDPGRYGTERFPAAERPTARPRPARERPPAHAEPAAHGHPTAHRSGPSSHRAAPPTAPPRQNRAENVNVVRSSGVMALGTLASRGTGFLRTLVIAYVLGVGAVSTAYNNANTLPNAVYDLMLGGILTSVVVPLLVNAAKRDADGGEAYDQRMFTLATIALGALTIVATLAAALLVDLYAHDLTGAEHRLTVIFAFFFIPQIFFYGVSSLAGGVLNARGHFAAPMWTPVLNNIVVIAVLLMFVVVGGISSSPTAITSSQIELLGFGTTLGIVLQTIALIPFLRRVGFRWRPRFDFRRSEVSEIRRMAAPLFGYIVTTQVSFLVVLNVANAAWRHASYDGVPTYSFAWQLFQMPYAIVGISVITALLPRMSAHAAERRFGDVKRDFSGGVRLSSAIVVPASLFLLVLGAPFAEAVLGYGRTTPADAKYIGLVFGIFSLGLVPYMMFQLMLRVFYAMHDSKTPMYIGVAVMVTNVAVSLFSLAALPYGHIVAGLAAAFGIANLVGTVIAWRILSRRMRGLAGKTIAVSLIHMHMAAVPGAIFALAVSFAVGVVLSPGPAFGIVTIIVGGSGALLLYVLFAKALGIRELTELGSGLRSRLGR
jgi:putative peptidoglycan lipid II flippase